MKKVSKTNARYVKYLEKENKKLEKKIQNLNLIFSTVAHDLRSPFNTFLNFPKLLYEEFDRMDPSEIKKIISLIYNNAQITFDLLESLLIWANLRRGLLVMDPVSIVLLSKVKKSIADYNQEISQKEIKIHINIPNDCCVCVDKNYFNTIFRNLFSNAIKFTPKKGEVTISTKFLGGNELEFLISDNGIGMSPEILENLFNPSVKTNRLGTEGELTHGFGLMNCKEIIESDGKNKLLIKSEVGKGTTVSFKLQIVC